MPDYQPLHTYNEEVARGIMHTPAYKAEMFALQTAYDNDNDPHQDTTDADLAEQARTLAEAVASARQARHARITQYVVPTAEDSFPDPRPEEPRQRYRWAATLAWDDSLPRA